jgi:hypothetical protein
MGLSRSYLSAVTLALLNLTGCVSVPPETTTRASAELRGQCFAMFAYPRFEGAQPAGLYAGRIGYQYWGETTTMKAFAVGFRQDGEQVCGYFWRGRLEANVTQEIVNAGAVDSCNKVASGGASCVVYAVGDTIVYDRRAHAIKLSQADEARAEFDRLQKQRAAELQERQRLVEQEKVREAARRQDAIAAEDAARLAAEKEAQAATERAALDSVKKTCNDLGFKSSTENFGKCVLQLLERERQKAQKDAPAVRPSVDSRVPTRGDGTPDDVRCQGFGYSVGTPPYAECRLKLELLSRQAEERRRDYERRQQEYEAQVAEYERQRKIAANLALVQCGLNMASGGTCSGARVGPAPVPPAPVAPARQTLVLPGGRIINCTTVGTITTCQ